MTARYVERVRKLSREEAEQQCGNPDTFVIKVYTNLDMALGEVLPLGFTDAAFRDLVAALASLRDEEVDPEIELELREARSISDDDLCHACVFCDYNPGDDSHCEIAWPGDLDEDGYCTDCCSFVGR